MESELGTFPTAAFDDMKHFGIDATVRATVNVPGPQIILQHPGVSRDRHWYGVDQLRAILATYDQNFPSPDQEKPVPDNEEHTPIAETMARYAGVSPQPEWLTRLTADMPKEIEAALITAARADLLTSKGQLGIVANAAIGLAASYLHPLHAENQELQDRITGLEEQNTLLNDADEARILSETETRSCPGCTEYEHEIAGLRAQLAKFTEPQDGEDWRAGLHEAIFGRAREATRGMIHEPAKVERDAVRARASAAAVEVAATYLRAAHADKAEEIAGLREEMAAQKADLLRVNANLLTERSLTADENVGLRKALNAAETTIGDLDRARQLAAIQDRARGVETEGGALKTQAEISRLRRELGRAHQYIAARAIDDLGITAPEDDR